MPISRFHKAIFIHIPKNAGESVEKSMGMYAGGKKTNLWGTSALKESTMVLQHMSAAQIKKLVSVDEWNEYTKFCIVRNPWSKAVSEYNWYLRFGPYCSFDNWVKSLQHRIKINKLINTLEIGHNLPQYTFIFDGDQMIVDNVLYFERLSDDFKRLARDNGWQVKLQHASTTASTVKKDFRDYYSKTSIEIIENIYKNDIDIFEYCKHETFN